MKTLTQRTTKPKVSTLHLTAKQLHLIARALADRRRFEIFQRIAATPQYVSCADLREAVDITPATMSHHLKELETAGLVIAVRDGKFMNLSLRRDIWHAYIAQLQKL
jgi:ArsR family transcriptional regulator